MKCILNTGNWSSNVETYFGCNHFSLFEANPNSSVPKLSFQIELKQTNWSNISKFSAIWTYLKAGLIIRV